MLCVLPFCQRDFHKLREMLQWINELGCCKNHDALFVCDAAVPWDDCHHVIALAKKSFHRVSIVSNSGTVEGWIEGSNSLFLTAAQWCQDNKKAWLWMEPDSVPIKPGWLDALDVEYGKCPTKFMGDIYTCNQPGLPNQILSGVALYPADAYLKIGNLIESNPLIAFDVSISTALPPTTSTPLIRHIWGTKENPPQFYFKLPPNAPPNSFTLANLHQDCVLFHRVKDSSLIGLLRQRSKPNDLHWVVYPFCNKDADMALKNMTWISELGNYNWDILLSYESDTMPYYVEKMKEQALKCFRCVAQTSYPPEPGWQPTVAFRHAAYYMADHIKQPFLWMEYDAIPLKPDWLEVLKREYVNSGALFANPIVSVMGHPNGTGIYPKDTPSQIPNALAQTEDAWDTRMKDEMIHNCHDLMPIYYHCWSVINEEFCPVGGGEIPSFPNQRMVDKIPKEAVIFHRSKYGDLIDRLRERGRPV